MKKVVYWVRGEIKDQGLLSFIMICFLFLICSPVLILCFVSCFFEWLNEKSKGLG